jgi:hypothetical protein
MDELAGSHRLAEQVPLPLVTLASLKKCELLRGFNTLCNQPQIKTPAYVDNCTHDARLIGRGGELTDKRLVNLEDVKRKLSKITQA